MENIIRNNQETESIVNDLLEKYIILTKQEEEDN